MRPAHAFLLSGLLLPVASAQAADPSDDLYAATVIVTGRDNLAERERGLAEALQAVLVRVSADPAVAGRWHADARTTRADAIVSDLHYLDRKEGIPISDEQGTRDRSFEMTATFDPKAIDALLARLGSRPWPAPRPFILVDLTVETAGGRYRLTESGEDGYSQRLALLDAAEHLGLRIALPAGETPSGEAARLVGDMRTTPAGLWDSSWRLGDGPDAPTHPVRGESFDATFANALAFSASELRRR